MYSIVMGRIFYVIIFVIVFIPIITNGQSYVFKQNDFDRGKTFKAENPDDDFICLESKYVFSFELEKGKEIHALQSVNETFISLNSQNYFSKVLFYDAKSEVYDIELYSKRGSKISANISNSDVEIEGVFHHDLKACSFGNTFDEKDTGFAYEYKKRYLDIRYLTTIYFTSDFYIDNRTIVFEIPDWLDLEFVEMNFEDYNITKEQYTKKNKRIITFSATDLDKELYEDNCCGKPFQYPHLVVIAKSYNYKKQSHNIINSTSDLYNWYNSFVLDVENDKIFLEGIVASLIENQESDLNKVEALFYWVQDNIRYIAFEEDIMGFKPESADVVYKNKYGDCKGMANLLKEMLVIAGFDAKLAWLGTRSLPYDYSIPSIAVGNHMVCVLDFEGQRYFLDATEKFIALNDYATRIQGKQILIQNGKEYIIDSIPVLDENRNLTESHYYFQISDGVIEGNAVLSLSGDEKVGFMRAYDLIQNNQKKDALNSYLGGFDKNIDVINSRVLNIDNREIPLVIGFDIELGNRIIEIDSLVYVDLNVKKMFDYADCLESRKSDFLFDHKFYDKTVIEFVIPLEYEIEYYPRKIEIDNEHYFLRMECVIQEDILISLNEIRVKKILVKVEDIQILENTLKEVSEYYNDYIILKSK